MFADPKLGRHCNPAYDYDTSLPPRFDGSEGIPHWVEYNGLAQRLARLRKHVNNMLLDISRARTLETGDATFINHENGSRKQ